jgi:hypothetical protein
MIPRFPFRGANFVVDDYLLFFVPLPFNFDFFYITIPLTFMCIDHATSRLALMPALKKARKEVV